MAATRWNYKSILGYFILCFASVSVAVYVFSDHKTSVEKSSDKVVLQIKSMFPLTSTMQSATGKTTRFSPIGPFRTETADIFLWPTPVK